MNKKILLVILLTVVLISIIQVAEAGKIKEDLQEKIKGKAQTEKVKVILQLNKQVGDVERVKLKEQKAEIKHEYKLIKAAAIEVPIQALDGISKNPWVDLIEPDYEVKTVLAQSVPQIGADKVQSEFAKGKDVTVAIVDTGISGNLKVIDAVDFTGEGAADKNGHGTHCAGIVASQDSTYKGVAPEAGLYNVKVLNQYGTGYVSDVIAGVEWAANEGADVISMSLGASVYPCDGTDAVSKAVDAASSKSVVVVAAGNSGPGTGTIMSPGCAHYAFTVGAVDKSDQIASFSSRGPTGDGRTKPDIVAPGVSITSLTPSGGFASLSGTSMAAPHIAGVVALILSYKPDASPVSLIKETAKNLNIDADAQGAGRVDAYAAFLKIVPPVLLPQCNDSDLMNYTFAGTCSDALGNWTDKCESEAMLTEYSCLSTNCSAVPVDCVKEGYTGCENGICVTMPPKNDTLPDPGVCPDHWAYKLEKFFEKIADHQAKGAGKSELALKRVYERIAEVKCLEQHNKTELIDPIEKEIEKKLKEAKEFGKDISNKAKKKQFEDKLKNANEVHVKVLEKVLEKAPEQAKQAIERNIERSKEQIGKPGRRSATEKPAPVEDKKSESKAEKPEAPKDEKKETPKPTETVPPGQAKKDEGAAPKQDQGAGAQSTSAAGGQGAGAGGGQGGGSSSAGGSGGGSSSGGSGGGHGGGGGRGASGKAVWKVLFPWI